MSGITLYAKDFLINLSLFELVLLKVLYAKDNEMWEMIKRNDPAFLKPVLQGLETGGYIKLLVDLSEVTSELPLDAIALRSPTLQLFKDEESSAIEVLEYLNSKIVGDDKNRKGFSTKSSANKKFINARLAEGYTVDDLKVVIDIMYKEWSNTKYDIYLRPETLFNPTKFAGYLVRANKSSKPTITNEML